MRACLLLVVCACSRATPPQPQPLPPEPASSPYEVRYDQLGYLPSGERWAVVLSAGAVTPQYRIYDFDNNIFIFSGGAGPRVSSTRSLTGAQLTADHLDLSAIDKPGRYEVVLQDGKRFGPILVGESVYASVIPALLRFFSVQRCGAVASAASAHGACHLFGSVANAHSGDGVAVDFDFTGHAAASTGPAVNVEGGWHDAGDYLKFVGTSSFTIAVDLLALRDHPSLSNARAGSVDTALRAEMRWGLDWLDKMMGGLDPPYHEPYHQVGGQGDHDTDWRLPESDTTAPIADYDQRPVVRFQNGGGADVLARAAAALALGAQVFASDTAYASKLLALARHTYALAVERPKPQPGYPFDSHFYDDDSLEDDLAFGAAELSTALGSNADAATYRAQALLHARALSGSTNLSVGWSSVDALALAETARLFAANSSEHAELAGILSTLAEPIVKSHTSPEGSGGAFNYALPTFGDGSIAQSLGAAATCIALYHVNGNPDCLEVARTQLHWLFGQNPFGLSFVVGLGTHSVQHPHHAVAQVHSAAGPFTLTGAVVGGPSSKSEIAAVHDSALRFPSATSPYAPWSTIDLAYEDSADNYVFNEPAIDMTAALVYVLGTVLETP